MKTVVYSPLGIRSTRLHLLLAVAQRAIDAGDDVVLITCDGVLPGCVSNPEHARAICHYCKVRQARGVALLSGPFAWRALSDYVDPGTARALAASADDLSDLDAVRAVRYGGADVGYAALSCYATATREPSPGVRRPRVRDVLQRLTNSGKIVYEAFGEVLRRERPDRVALFNARHSADRAALRRCQQEGVDCDVYEVTRNHGHYTVFRNVMHQDIASTVAAIERAWAEAGGDRERVAHAFFAACRGARFANNVVYTDAQVQGTLPAGWDEARRNVVVFSSSEDEYVSIGEEWERGVYPTQAEAVRRISAALRTDPAFAVWLRMHPNSRGLDRSYVRELRGLAGAHANLVVVPPESEACSYTMMERADVVLTFGSTMGYEATYWGKPSVLLKNCFHRGLGATWDPETHEEVVALLWSDLAPRDRTVAMKMAYFRMTSGERMPHYDGDRRGGPRNGAFFKGDRIAVRGPARLLYKLAKRRWRRSLTPDTV